MKLREPLRQRKWARQRGQALGIGVAMIFVLALFMYLIAAFGHHVQQKVQVQTVADATALSLATMEAESLNYIAFANRAQAAQYVMALNLDAYISYVSWAQATLSAIKNIPLYGTPFAAAYPGVVALVNGADEALPLMMNRVDDANRALWYTELASAEIVQLHLLLGGHEFFDLNATAVDPTWKMEGTGWELNGLMTVLNNLRWMETFSKAGGRPLPGSPSPSLPNGTDADTQAAQRTMTEIVNGTRADSMLLARGFLPIGGSLFNFLNQFTRFIKRGQTKLISQSNVDSIFNTSQDDSDLTTGSVMASDDAWALTLGSLSLPLMHGSVWAKIDGSSCHIRTANLLGVGACASGDSNHKYKGISPYMTYQAGLRASQPGAPGEDFHQPDVFVWLYKDSDQATMPGALNFSFEGAPAFHTTVTGIHAIARAQAYYHRPGNWQEPPNLFNPFWRAHLAPIAPGISGLVSGTPAGNALAPILNVLQPFLDHTLLTH